MTMYDSSGMIASDPAPAAPSNVDMSDPDQTQTPGFLSSLESFASGAIQHAENGIADVYGAGKTVVGDVAGGVEGVVQKTVNIGTGAITSVTMNIVIVLGIVAIALVYIAKSGAIKATITR